MTDTKLTGRACDLAQEYYERWDNGTLRLARFLDAHLLALQPCGHPRACIVSGPCPDCGGSGYIADGRGGAEPCGCNADVTSYCGWCAAYNKGYGDAVRELTELMQRKDDSLSQVGGWSWRDVRGRDGQADD